MMVQNNWSKTDYIVGESEDDDKEVRTDRERMQIGVGVLFDGDGSVLNQVPQARGRGRPMKHQPTLGTQSSQASIGHQPTQ
uniref:Uncharacterized protein n=1 Tax=Chenopodium quinoa TaxID=63459 RepID=A0A803LCE0_CHEQI